MLGGRERDREQRFGDDGRLPGNEEHKTAEEAVSLSRSVSHCKLESHSHYMHV